MTSGVLLDLSGVLYEGQHTLAGAREALQRLREAGLPIRFLTNTTRKTRQQLLQELERLDLDVRPDELFTAAQAAADTLTSRGLTPLLVVHEQLRPDLARFEGAQANAVLVADAAEGFEYGLLNEAFRLLIDGAPLLAVGRNRYFKEGDQLSLDAGPFVAALEYAAGVEAEVVGKPASAFFQAALDSLGCAAEDTVMVGDDVDSDVNGALAAGIAALLVRTGKYRDGDDEAVKPGGDCVRDIGEAVDRILA